MENRYEKKQDESQFEYGLRLISIKMEDKPDDLEWNEICEKLNLNVHYDTLRKASQTEYGGYNVAKYYQKILEEQFINKNLENGNTDVLLDLELKKSELKEERKKISLLRSEITRMINEKVKYDNLVDIFERIIKENNLPKYINEKELIHIFSENEMIIGISDAHYGMEINNEFEKYSPSIFVDRLNTYYHKILKIKNTHDVNSGHIVLLGDIISGIIHNVIRIENSENMIQQIQKVSEILSDFIYKLSLEFDMLNIYFVTGNHSRNMQNKNDSMSGERLENLIIWYLKARLSEIKSIKFHNSIADNTIVKTNICNRTCVFTHGDNDTGNTIISKMTNMFEEKIDLVLMGHYHSFNVQKQGKSTVVTSGAFLSNDEYCITKRLMGEPSQAVIILNKDEGFVNAYDVKLD